MMNERIFERKKVRNKEARKGRKDTYIEVRKSELFKISIGRTKDCRENKEKEHWTHAVRMNYKKGYEEER